MNHYCTYFDRGFLVQGLALWRSLQAHDAGAVLWILALDDFTADVLTELDDAALRVVPLADLEAGDPGLAAAKSNRTRVEYYFTLSPCWPRWLLASHPEVGRITYLDADLFFLAGPEAIFAPMDSAGASVLITAHRFPGWLDHYNRHGRFNVGILAFRNDAAGRRCLDRWRDQCLEWCHDRLEGDRYADQKYLDAWPATLGAALLVLDDPRVNLAPWNWAAHEEAAHAPILFHFARFRPLIGDWWWWSGQLEYGVMPWRLRQAIYGRYWRGLQAARAELARRRPGFDFSRRSLRLGREFWRTLPLRLLFGGDWLRVGDRFYNGRGGLGRWSGRCLAAMRAIFGRK